MRMSKGFLPTLKEVPADATVASHQLLVRAGFVRQLSAGIYCILPLGQRSILKITEIVRDDFMGGVRSGVNGTPAFFINDRRHDRGFDLRSLSEAITTALAMPRGHDMRPEHRRDLGYRSL